MAEHYGIGEESFFRHRSSTVTRNLTAWLARELRPVTSRSSRPREAPGLRRAEIEAIRQRLPKTGPDAAKILFFGS